jgi:hypothetical protein
MQASHLTIATPNVKQVQRSSIFAKISDWVARVFGCWHLEISRPFSHHGHAYRVCLNCGAQRQFNLRSWQMHGNFYYERATTSKFYPANQLAAVKKAA